MTDTNFEIRGHLKRNKKNATKSPKGVFKHHISGLGRVGDLTPITDALEGGVHSDADIILEYVFSSKW